MYKSFSLAAITVLLVESLGVCQQTSNTTSNILNLVHNRDVFLNPVMINPTQLTDSNTLNVDFILHQQWLGAIDPNQGVSVKGETGIIKKRLSFGLLLDYKELGLTDHRSAIGSAQKGFSLGGYSKLKFGLNFGLWQSRPDGLDLIFQDSDPLIESHQTWQSTPVIDLGVHYQFKKQNFGISYNNILAKSQSAPIAYYVRSRCVIINYQGIYSLSNSIFMVPEIITAISSDDNCTFLAAKVVYRNMITCGLLYNTENAFGLLLSGTIFKKVKIGYYIDYASKGPFKQETGAHGLNLGVML